MFGIDIGIILITVIVSISASIGISFRLTRIIRAGPCLTLNRWFAGFLPKNPQSLFNESSYEEVLSIRAVLAWPNSP